MKQSLELLLSHSSCPKRIARLGAEDLALDGKPAWPRMSLMTGPAEGGLHG